MKAMILAAGRGERMRPLTDKCPKPLLKVGGDFLIGWHLRRLKTAGFNDIVINNAWLGRQIEEALGSGKQYGVNIRYSAEGNKGFETAGGIATALPLLGNEPFLVVNGDVFTDIDFQQVFIAAKTVKQQQKLAHLWLVNNPDHNPNGDFFLQENGLVDSQAKNHNELSLTFSGVGVYHPSLFVDIVPRQSAKLAPLLRQAMARHLVTGQHHPGLWLDVGTIERLELVNQLVHAAQQL